MLDLDLLARFDHAVTVDVGEPAVGGAGSAEQRGAVAEAVDVADEAGDGGGREGQGESQPEGTGFDEVSHVHVLG